MKIIKAGIAGYGKMGMIREDSFDRSDRVELVSIFDLNKEIIPSASSISNSIDELKTDLEKYSAELFSNLSSNLTEVEKNEIRSSLKKLILKLQKMNSFAVSKANLSDEFHKYSS